MAGNGFYDVVIIGAGPGGLSAGIYSMRAAMNTVLLEKGLPGGQVVTSNEVENYLGFEHINGADLADRFYKHALSYDLEIIDSEVSVLEPGNEFHTVRIADKGIIRTHSVIMATGGSPRKLNIPGEEEYYGKGVSYCAVCDGFFFRDKTVVVVGGGDSAAEEALYLAKLARQVYIVHRRDELRASRILQQRIHAEKKIKILWSSVVTAINADEDGVSSVDLKDTGTGEQDVLKTDGVFIFIGFKPNSELAPAGIKLSAQGYVMTDEKCETRIPGIFAVGDLREKYARQIVSAAADGCTAALAAAHYVEKKKAGSR